MMPKSAKRFSGDIMRQVIGNDHVSRVWLDSIETHHNLADLSRGMNHHPTTGSNFKAAAPQVRLTSRAAHGREWELFLRAVTSRPFLGRTDDDCLSPNSGLVRRE